jgi:hypothetical protein
MTKKKIVAIASLVIVAGIGIAKVLGYDVAPVCEVVPSLCQSDKLTE